MKLDTHIIEGRGHPGRLLFLIHGYYSQPYALSALGPLIDPDAHFLVMAPRGPHPLPPHDSYWYERTAQGINAASFLEVTEALNELIDTTCAARGFRRQDTVIGGFSQGASLALALAMQDSDRARPSGVMCLSGFLPNINGLSLDYKAARHVAVFVAHGAADPLVPIDSGRQVARTLQANGLPVTFHEYPIGHDITIESLIDMRSWLEAVRKGDGYGP